MANPPGGYCELGPFAGTHLIRETAWFALGALAHGEMEIAVQALETVLGRQYDCPGQPWHGTFPIFDHDPEPGDDAIMWLSYDPNWRQFIGVALALIVEQYSDRLPAATVDACATAVVRCVAGEPLGRIAPSYTNPALMHAWLADWVGRRFDLPSCRARGWALAEEIMGLFDATGTLYEFNSPTYDGVNLLAATLWACAGEPLRSAGRRLAGALVESLGFLYHPVLHNLCGPFTRAYGMDLSSRITLYGLWRLVALADPTALPPLVGAIPHSHDLYFAPLVEWAACRTPHPFPAGSTDFPRQRVFQLNQGRTATAFLGADMMIGAERGGREGLVWDQYVPGSVHWLSRGQVYWLRVHAEQAGPVDCELAAPGTLIATPAGDSPHLLRVSTNAPVEHRGRTLVRAGSRVAIESRPGLVVNDVGDVSFLSSEGSPGQPLVVTVDSAPTRGL